MADCPACHAVNRDSARFCLNCGHALQAVLAAPSAAMPVSDSCACPACGEENRAGRKFCKHCGSAMLAATDTAPVLAAPPAAPVVSAIVVAAADAPAPTAAEEAAAIVPLEPAVAVVRDEDGARTEEEGSQPALASAEPAPMATVAIVPEAAPDAERATVATLAGSEPLAPVVATEPVPAVPPN